MSALSSLTLISTVCASPSITSSSVRVSCAAAVGVGRAEEAAPSAGASAAGWGALIVVLKANCVPASPHSTAKRPSSRCPIHATATMSAPMMTSGSVHTVLGAIRPPTSSSRTPVRVRRTRGRMSQAQTSAPAPVSAGQTGEGARAAAGRGRRRGSTRRRCSQTGCRSRPSSTPPFDPGARDPLPGATRPLCATAPPQRGGAVDNGPRMTDFAQPLREQDATPTPSPSSTSGSPPRPRPGCGCPRRRRWPPPPTTARPRCAWCWSSRPTSAGSSSTPTTRAARLAS